MKNINLTDQEKMIMIRTRSKCLAALNDIEIQLSLCQSLNTEVESTLREGYESMTRYKRKVDSFLGIDNTLM